MTPAAQSVSSLPSSQAATQIRTPLATVVSHLRATQTRPCACWTATINSTDRGCLSTWWRTASNLVCPLFKK